MRPVRPPCDRSWDDGKWWLAADRGGRAYPREGGPPIKHEADTSSIPSIGPSPWLLSTNHDQACGHLHMPCTAGLLPSPWEPRARSRSMPCPPHPSKSPRFASVLWRIVSDATRSGHKSQGLCACLCSIVLGCQSDNFHVRARMSITYCTASEATDWFCSRWAWAQARQRGYPAGWLSMCRASL